MLQVDQVFGNEELMKKLTSKKTDQIKAALTEIGVSNPTDALVKEIKKLDLKSLKAISGHLGDKVGGTC